MSDDILTLEKVKEYAEALVIALSAKLEQRISEVEAQLDSREQQMANLIVGFGEQAVFIEALIAQLSFASEDEQKSFHRTVADSRKEMLKVMQEASRGSMEPENQGLAAAIDDVATAKSSDS